MAIKGAPQRLGVHSGLRTGARHVRFGSKADMQCTRRCLLCANSGLMRRSKQHLYSEFGEIRRRGHMQCKTVCFTPGSGH